MQLRKIALNEINPAPYNPRVDLKPGDPEYEKLKSSLESFGYVEPLVWNEQTRTLVSGHQRLKILKEQGVQDVEVSVVDLPIDKEKLLNLALNKIRGEWDGDKLAELLQELQAVPDINIGLAGFEMPEISEILDSHTELTKDDDFDFQAALGANEEPVTKRGDIIQLGDHRILCGDSSKPEDLQLLLGDERAQLLHTDPPYNVDYYGGNRPHDKGRPKQSGQWERIYSDNMTQEEYETWLRQVFSNMAVFLAEGAPVYVWNGHRQFGPMHLMLCELGFHIAGVITWAKPNFAIGYGDYNQQTEFCLYAWRKENGAHKWYGPSNESTLWEINRDKTSDYQHPTQKPVAIPARAIKNSSVRGDIVLDLFLGSGSTLIGAESLGRRCYGIEIDPKYCDAIVRRYIAFAGPDKVSDEVRAKYMAANHGK